jgi:hypothetical protein
MPGRFAWARYHRLLDVLDSNYHHTRAKIRKAEIKAIFNDLQERANIKIIDYFEELEH